MALLLLWWLKDFGWTLRLIEHPAKVQAPPVQPILMGLIQMWPFQLHLCYICRLHVSRQVS